MNHTNGITQQTQHTPCLLLPLLLPQLSQLLQRLLPLIVSLVTVFSTIIPTLAAAEQDPATTNTNTLFLQTLDNLKQQSFKKKGAAITQLQAREDPRVLIVFKAMLDGKLYYRKNDKLIVIISPMDEGIAIIDVINQKSLGIVEKSTLKKISTNNRLRKQLRGAIAQLNLQHPDSEIRLAAVMEMLAEVDTDTADLFRQILKQENNADVIEAMQTAIALVDIQNENSALRLSAINILGNSLTAEAHNRLTTLVAKNDEGVFSEPDKTIRLAAQTALHKINDKRDFYAVIETIFFGLSLGSVLLLAAIGLAITFGVMGVINMAHGELIMIGAYTTYVVQLLMPNHIEFSLFVAIPAAFIVSGLFGIAIERGVIRFLYGRPLETLLATFGISLILQQLVRSIFSPLNRAVETPEWMSGSMEINNALAFTYNRFYIIIFSLLVFFALMAILKKTSLGLQVRAVSQNRSMAKAMGVKTGKVDALTFGLGSGIAGVAGVALSQLTNVGPNLGQSYIIDSFMVVVFGGVGNLWGTLVAGMSLGVINKFLEPWSGAVLAKILVLVFIILFIQKRPRGLFPQKGRAAEH